MGFFQRIPPARRVELSARWNQLGDTFALPAAQHRAWQREGRRLVRSWSRWPRSYHDTTHLAACLRHADSVRSQLADPGAVALALWYHDAVYWPWRGDNERRSADQAVRFLSRLQPSGRWQQLAAQVEALVMATVHVAAVPPATQAPAEAATVPTNVQWLVDIDLAVLGQSAEVFDAFERNVRREYRFVPWPRYVAGRSAVLQSFLDRPEIYATPWFAERLEATARINLGAAIDRLQQPVR